MTRSELGKSLNLEIDLIPAGRQNRPGTRIEPKYITIHGTSNTDPGADARAHGKFVKNTGFYWIGKEPNRRKNWVSWHYTVDDTRVVKHLEVNEKGLHAGAGNAVSVAMEICMNSDGDQKAAIDRAARLTAILMFDLGIRDASKVKPHHHWTGKNCPSILMDGGKPGAKWQAFVAKAKGYLDAIPLAV